MCRVTQVHLRIVRRLQIDRGCKRGGCVESNFPSPLHAPNLHSCPFRTPSAFAPPLYIRPSKTCLALGSMQPFACGALQSWPLLSFDCKAFDGGDGVLAKKFAFLPSLSLDLDCLELHSQQLHHI
jgi:hypothetical protein